MVSQVAVARYLKSAYEALHWAETVPGVIIKTQVREVAHRDESLFAKCPQAIVL